MAEPITNQPQDSPPPNQPQEPPPKQDENNDTISTSTPPYQKTCVIKKNEFVCFDVQEPIFERLKYWLRQTDHFVGQRLDDVHRLTFIDPVISAFAFSSLVLYWVYKNPHWGGLLCQFISSCTYPLVKGYEALSARDKDGLRVWCAYWYVFDNLGTFDILERFTRWYWPIKMCVLCFFFLPPIQYISVVYDAWLLPVIEIVYGELEIETLRWAHPVVLKWLNLDRAAVYNWEQGELEVHLVQCDTRFYRTLLFLNKYLAEKQVIIG